MRTEEEVKKRLKKIEVTYERDRPKPAEKCKCCGHSPPFMGTWMFGDDARYGGRIQELKWILEDSEFY